MAVAAASKSRRKASAGIDSVPKATGIARPDTRKPTPKSVLKTADNKGRVVLGELFANRAVILEKLSDTEMIVKLARVIPESEAWLYDNAEALTAVRTGLAQARAGQLTGGPDLNADADLAKQLQD